jgi:hypothetical protein
MMAELETEAISEGVYVASKAYVVQWHRLEADLVKALGPELHRSMVRRPRISKPPIPTTVRLPVWGHISDVFKFRYANITLDSEQALHAFLGEWMKRTWEKGGSYAIITPPPNISLDEKKTIIVKLRYAVFNRQGRLASIPLV